MRAKHISLAVILAVQLANFFTLPAWAQLPRVQLPVTLPSAPGGVLPDLARGVGGAARDLSGVRSLRAQRLLAENRAELDRDASGELVVRAEVVAIDITPEALTRALGAKFSTLRTLELADLGVKITVLQTPRGVSARQGLKRLRKLDPAGTYDYNHVYLDSGESHEPANVPPIATPSFPDSGPMRVGLIDGGVDDTHVSLRSSTVHHFGCAGALVPNAHGESVASLLAGGSAAVELFAADVYCGLPTGGAVDAVAAAFAWMAQQKVGVINVSLVGPRNALLERIVATLVARGHLIVAAVGNDGPAAAPLFPAAYDGVIGVTAVDKSHRVLIEACRGRQVTFAARGADMDGATLAPDGHAPVRGTSFAAPEVSRLLALRLGAPDPAAAKRALDSLAAEARDLGKPGRDEVYGFGEVGESGRAP